MAKTIVKDSKEQGLLAGATRRRVLGRQNGAAR